MSADNLISLDPIYLGAAAAGNPLAQASLAGALMAHASESDPHTGSDLLAMAEVFALLAAISGEPAHVAALGRVRFCRSMMLLDTDPIRAALYREEADKLFDCVMAHGDPDGLEVVAQTLSMFAEHNNDDAAAARLSAIVAQLPAERAVLLREWTRQHQAASAPMPVKETR